MHEYVDLAQEAFNRIVQDYRQVHISGRIVGKTRVSCTKRQ